MDIVTTPIPQIINDVGAAAQEIPVSSQIIIMLVQLLPLLILLLPLGLIIERIIMGMLCKRMAAKKGYKGYFWTGFLLGTIGFVYVIFLPDLRMQKYIAMCASKMQGLEASLSAMEKAMYPQQPAPNPQQPYNNSGYNNYGY